MYGKFLPYNKCEINVSYFCYYFWYCHFCCRKHLASMQHIVGAYQCECHSAFFHVSSLAIPSATNCILPVYLLHFVNIDFETGRETFITLNCNKIITIVLNIQLEIKFHCIMQRQLLICACSQTRKSDVDKMDVMY